LPSYLKPSFKFILHKILVKKEKRKNLGLPEAELYLILLFWIINCNMTTKFDFTINND